MKWVGVFVLGLLLGVIAACGVLYVNPLSSERLSEVDSTTLLSYEFGPDTLSFTHGDQLGFDLQPRDVPALWESTIRRMMLGTFVLNDLQGNPAALASRTIRLSPRSNLLLRGVLVADNWLVTVPGAGSYFIESEANVWPLLLDTVVDVNLLGGSWQGSQHYELTAGPDDRGAASLVGITGRFAGVSGAAVHTMELTDYTDRSQLLNPASGQLRLDLRRPAQQAATSQ